MSAPLVVVDAEALATIQRLDAALAETTSRELVPAGEVMDLLLDVRQMLLNAEAVE